MGVDKARVPYPGRWPMAVHVAGVLRGVCERVALVRHAPDGLPWGDPEGRTIELVYDDVGSRGDADGGASSGDAGGERLGAGGRHPLLGVAAALRAGRTELVVVVPCDAPRLTVAALTTLIAGAGPGGAVAWDGERTHPLIAVYPRARADEAAERAARGDAARAFADDAVRVRLADEVLWNLNRWADAARPGPVGELLDALPWLDEAARRRVAAGERQREQDRGVADPGDQSND